MINKALRQNIKIILCTPTWDNTYYEQNELWKELEQHANQIRMLASKYNIGLADSFKEFGEHISKPEDLVQYLSGVNHPTKAGHELVAKEIGKYFVAR